AQTGATPHQRRLSARLRLQPCSKKVEIADCGLSQEPQTNVCSTVSKKHEAGHEQRLYGTGNTLIGKKAVRDCSTVRKILVGGVNAFHLRRPFLYRATGRHKQVAGCTQSLLAPRCRGEVASLIAHAAARSASQETFRDGAAR